MKRVWLAIDRFQSYRVIFYIALKKWVWWITNSSESWISLRIYDCAHISTTLKDCTIRKDKFQSSCYVCLSIDAVAIIISIYHI